MYQPRKLIPKVIFWVLLEEDVDLLDGVVELILLDSLANALDLGLDGCHAGSVFEDGLSTPWICDKATVGSVARG